MMPSYKNTLRCFLGLFLGIFAVQENSASFAKYEEEDATDHWAHFLTLFDHSCVHILPFPRNFIEDDVIFSRGEDDAQVLIFSKGTEDILEDFRVPKELDIDNLRPYFEALKKAVVSQNADALRVHERFRALLKELGRISLLQDLESTPLSPEELVEHFPAWVDALRTRFIDPFEEDPVAFIRHHTDNAEWVETVFRGWFLLADGAKVTAEQAIILIDSATSLGEVISAFTEQLFRLFDKDQMAAWEEEFFQSAQKTTEEDSAGSEGTDSVADLELDFTPEEQRASVRRRMLMVHQMLQQAYLTVEDLEGSLKIDPPPPIERWDEDVYQAHKDASDLQMKELFYNLHDVFTGGGTLHNTKQLVLARKDNIEHMTSYLDFMSTLLERRSEAALKVVGHPLYRFKETLGEKENEQRLGFKIQHLEEKLIPAIETAIAYYKKEGLNYIEMIQDLPVPDDLEVGHVAALHHAQDAAKIIPGDYRKKAHKWHVTLQGGDVMSREGCVVKQSGLLDRLKQLKDQRVLLRETLEMPTL